MKTIVTQMEAGRLYLFGMSVDNDSKEWIAHPAYAGVALKHLVTGAQTNGQFSAHMVKVNPGCVLDEHVHDGKTEMHEVVSGSGLFIMDEAEHVYTAGDISIIPSHIKHKVIAGDSGLYLLAKFIPALL